MIVDNSLSGRPAWYDRAPAIAFNVYEAVIAPAGSTVRFTYTVPTAKKAYCEQGTVWLRRVTVAAPVGRADCRFVYTPSGGGANALVMAVIYGNVADAADRDALSSAFIMLAGDVMQFYTSDASTGGTVDFFGSLKATEFSN